MMRLTVWTVLITFTFLHSGFAQEVQLSKKYPGDTKRLEELSLAASKEWKNDSARAVELGFPLLVGEGAETMTFTKMRNGLPVYVKTNTLDEVQSYFGDDLWSAPYGVTGTNLPSGIWEAFSGPGALPNPANGNFTANGTAPSRVLIANGGFVSNHANTVALAIAGDGTANSNSGAGIAKSSILVAWDVTNYIAELAANATSLLVSNHSYSEIRGWNSPISVTLNGSTQDVNWWSESNVSQTEDYGFGRYSNDDADLDLIAYFAPFHCIVKSAGNDRGDNAANGGVPPAQITTFNTANSGVTYTFDTYATPVPEQDGGSDGFDCLPSSTSAKNAFIIGACDDISGGYLVPADVNLRSFSAFGPTNDGRLKPDFVAPGEGGTSFSAPNVSGAILLLQEIALNETGGVYRSSTIKALLAQTAFEAGNTGPDYKHGWGLINPKGAADLIINTDQTNKIIEDFLPNGQTKTYYGFKDASGAVAVTLAWTDPDGTPRTRTFDINDLTETRPMLVNDLNVKVTEVLTTSVNSPYVLDPINPNNLATTGMNSLDNCEKVDIASANTGWYEIEISHTGTLVDDDGNTDGQLFSLVMSGFDVYSCIQEGAVSFNSTWESGAWTGGVPTSVSNVLITENLTLSASLSANNVVIKEGVEIDLGAFDFDVNGSLSSEGEVSFSGSGQVNFTGSSSQKICGDLDFDNITVDNSNGLSVVDAEGFTTVNSLMDLTNGTVVTNGRVRFRSVADASNKEYAQINNGSGDISGNVFFENTIQGASGWRNLASPVSTTIADVLFDQDQYNISNSGGSVYRWNAANSQWEAPTDENDPFNATNPYTVFFGTSVVGSNNYVFNAMPFNCRLFGQPTNGNVDNTLAFHNGSGGNFISVDTDGWNLIANPYPQNLDWTQINTHPDFGNGNISNSYYIWDADQQKYLTHTGSMGDAELGGKIAPMQAFYVKLNNAGAATSTALDFENSDRTSAKAQFLKTSFPYLSLGLYTDNDSLIDRTHFGLLQGAKEIFEAEKDAYQLKFSPITSSIIYSGTIANGDTTALAVNALPNDEKELIVPLFIETTTSSNYKVGIDSTSFPSNWIVELIDAADSTVTDLNLHMAIKSISTNSRPFRYWLRINGPDIGIFENDLILDAEAWIANRNVHILLPSEMASTVSLFAIDGMLVFEGDFNEMEFTIPMSNLGAGIYLIHIETAKGNLTTKLVLAD